MVHGAVPAVQSSTSRIEEGMMIRDPIVDGRFYPGTPTALHDTIERLVRKDVPKEDVIGLVSPHAGYIYSGMVAGATFSRVRIKDTVVILGPNHTGRGMPLSIISGGRWKTPLGEVKVDTELSRQILKNSRYLEEDATAHRYEHSIEVQVPFIQYFKSDATIVPIVLAHYESDVYKEIGSSIARAISDMRREAIIVASSDMTHYEPHEVAQRKDAQAIEAIVDLNEDELLKRVEALNISMCGYAPTVSLISAAKELGAREAKLVHYQTSGEISGDYSSVVGYAGIIIKG